MTRIAALLASMVLVTTASAESFLKNSGFDGKLAPWQTDDGKLAADPENPKNSVLRLEVDTTFGLTQAFTWPKGKKELALSFRARAQGATKNSPFALRVRLYDKAGNSALANGCRITQSGKWITYKLTLTDPDFPVVSLMLESNQGEGVLWLDDVVLE